MVRKGYKETELGEIPEEWEIKILNEISSITRLAGYEYSSIWEENPNGEIIALRGFNIEKNKINFKDIVKISNKLSLRLNRSRLYKGDIVYPCVGSIGNAAVIEENDKYHIQQNIAKITPNRYILSFFLAYYLMSPLAMDEVKRFNASSSQPNVLVGSLRKFQIITPPLPEQHRIGTVLGTIDECIEKTEALIAKLNSVKAGLMQDLLTRGIDTEGRIRDESTHEFKDTEIGRVPVEWEVKRLDHIVDSFKNGIYKEEKYYGSGYPSVRMYNISDGLINLNNTPLLYVTETELREYGLVENDILINRVNSAELVGKVGIVPKGLGPITFESKNIRIRVKTDISLPPFVNTYLSFEKGAKQVKNGIKPAISQSTINQEDLGKVLIPNFSLSEQKQICQIIDSLQKRIFHEETYRDKLLYQKNGLMDDLLTGKVRVTESIVSIT